MENDSASQRLATRGAGRVSGPLIAAAVHLPTTDVMCAASTPLLPAAASIIQRLEKETRFH